MIIYYYSFLFFLLGLNTTRWTAITGSQQRANHMKSEFKNKIREQDEVIFGNWLDPNLLKVILYYFYFYNIFKNAHIILLLGTSI